MDITIEIDLGHAARELGLPLESVQNTVMLLDDGNTVPFVTRFRKDQTGALDEEQVRRIQEKVGNLRALADRKQTILKTIHSQGILAPELLEQIRTATSSKRLEDLYLPYKPKKLTLATTARQRGLEPLAHEVLDADPAATDLQTRAASLVAPDNELHSLDDVLAGVRHIIAEWFSERADARGRLRKVLQRTAQLICSRVEPAARLAAAGSPESADADPQVDSAAEEVAEEVAEDAADRFDSVAEDIDDRFDSVEAEPASTEEHTEPASTEEHAVPESAASEVIAPGSADAAATAEPVSTEETPTAEPVLPEAVSAEAGDLVPDAGPVAEVADPAPAMLDELAVGAEPPAVALPPMSAVTRKVLAKKRSALRTAVSKKEKKRQRLEAAFKDYFVFQESISRIPPHRVLAINRGERARILRVKMNADMDAMTVEAEKLLIPEGHPHADFLRSCVRDALGRLLVPSLERELRREMAEIAEEHAVGVFARNLRKLLLQPPVYHHRVLAVDPGFRSGCKLIALDEFGNVLGHEIIHVIGREDWIRAGRAKLVELIRRYQLSVIAIGNGAGCRETEQLVVNVMNTELKDDEVSFVIVNEAGASVYSTSPVGREELPTYDAVLRSAISIGRRLLDPLSELVKINPANIGVGMYQHDVKAKHLRNSLDAVVESCVNFVGVDVNTASPALLRYVSGMNQLTARRLCEYRSKHGPFRSRDQLKQVSGLGEATFVQAAGFLKISNGDNPLDATWIHPESYELALRVLAHAGCDVADLVDRPRAVPAPVGVVSARDTSSPEQPVEATLEIPLVAEDAAPAVTQEVSSTLVATAPTPDASADAGAADSAETGSAAQELAPDLAGWESSAPAPVPSTEERAEPECALPAAAAAGEAEPMQRAREKLRQLNAHALAQELSVSELLLRDILNSLVRPGRDPREDLPAPVFRRGIVKLEDLEPGMMLSGTVLNVVDFGAFVDIGLPDSGLVHISRLADRFVRDPHEVVGVGDVLTVWVVEIDKQRRRVSLTAIEPGTEKPTEARREPARPRPRSRPQKPPANRPAGRAAEGRPPTQAESRAAGDRPKTQQRPRPPQKPKFVKPITKEMEEGKEPLRSFSDLMQFYQKKPPDGK